MMILRIRDADGNIQEVLVIKGENGKDGIDGKDYVLTEADKQEIANIVMGALVVPTDAGYLTEEEVLELIQNNMPVSGEEVSY